MDRLYFDDYIDMAEYMYDEASDDVYIVAVLYYNDAIQLLRELLSFDDVEISALEIEPPFYNGYDREYFISIDEYKTLSVEPAYVGGRYLNTDADKLLLGGDVHANAMADSPIENCYEILVDEDCDCGCECSDCKSDSIYEFTVTLGELLETIIDNLSF